METEGVVEQNKETKNGNLKPMKMIEVEDLTGKFPEDIVNLLLDHGKQPFEIWIPKSTALFNSEREAIAIDYLYLAYCGQLLSSVSDEFDYEYIPPVAHESVPFKVRTKDIEALAKVLFDLSFGYVNDPQDEVYLDEDEVFEFAMWADQFMSDVEEGKITPVSEDFFDDYREFIRDNE